MIVNDVPEDPAEIDCVDDLCEACESENGVQWVTRRPTEFEAPKLCWLCSVCIGR